MCSRQMVMHGLGLKALAWDLRATHAKMPGRQAPCRRAGRRQIVLQCLAPLHWAVFVIILFAEFGQQRFTVDA